MMTSSQKNTINTWRRGLDNGDFMGDFEGGGKRTLGRCAVGCHDVGGWWGVGGDIFFGLRPRKRGENGRVKNWLGCRMAPLV